MNTKNFFIAILFLISGISLYNYQSFQRWYNLGFEAAVTDVVFHGKVIDQYEAPVAGAKVSYLITGQFLAAGAGRGYTITDEQGHFSIRGKGAKIVVNDIIQPQINYNPPTPEVAPLLTGGRNVPIRISDWKKYTVDSPYLFKAWRVEKYENVIKGGDFYALIPDGRTYTYDPSMVVSVNQSSKKLHEGETDGYLRVNCERAEMAHGRDFQDWRMTLTPVDGGIQPTDDIYMNQAPEVGYKPSITIEQKKSSPDYQSVIINQRYFFTAHNGDVYGSLFVHYDPHFRNNECNIEISYKMNMEGSRNLAVKVNQY